MKLKNARLLDPQRGIDGLGWVKIEHGLIQSFGFGQAPFDDGTDLQGWLLTPSFVDTHVHFRAPGGEHKETIQTGACAALRGGYSAVVTMANTNPAIDNPDLVKWEIDQGKKAGIKLYPAAAVTVGLKGKVLTDFVALKAAGAQCLSDDGYPIVDEAIAKKAYEEAKRLGLRISIHPEDPDYGGDRSIHRGPLSEQFGLVGVHPEAENRHIRRDLALAEETGAGVMVQHVSTKAGCQAIREAKSRGVDVCGEATPHHMALTCEDVARLGTSAKMSPPLRPEEDRQGVFEAFMDGTLDCLATDHAPHSPEEKALPLGQAPNGIIGLETAFSVVYALIKPFGDQGLYRLIDSLTHCPRRAMSLPEVGFFAGSPADLTLLDLEEEWLCDVQSLGSKSRNCPWLGQKMQARVKAVIIDGEVAYRG